MPKFFVHRYEVVRVKVAVEAADHADAMRKADEHLANDPVFRERTIVADEYAFAGLVPYTIAFAPAEEVTGYLVDNADDDDFEGSRSYGPDHKIEEPK